MAPTARVEGPLLACHHCREVLGMFVNIVRHSAVKPGSGAAFCEWFVESNEAYARLPGFSRRRLLVPREGTYAAVVEGGVSAASTGTSGE